MIGQTISHYTITEKLGEGGMGVVYKARDTRLDRDVALKFLPVHASANKETMARFLQEARAAAALNHANICTIYGVEEHEGKMFIAMEYIDGGTLREKLPLAGIAEFLPIALQIGEALHEAHARDIVHRDIKADNIMLTSRGQVKVMDFGLAKLKGSMKLTRTSSTVGTLGYMAPEQIGGGEVDARSDLFSFGVLLFEMLTGRLPFKGEHEAAIIYSIMNQDPEPLVKYFPDAPPELVMLVSKSLEKDPAERYQSVSEMLVDLRRLRKSAPSHSRQFPVQARSAVSGTQTSSTPVSGSTVPLPSVAASGKKGKIIIGMVVVLAVLVSVAIFMMKENRVYPSINNVRMTQLTSAGNAGYATVSPDGKYVVYSKGERGEVSLWIRQVVSSTDVMVIPPSDIVIEGSTFSNDGNYLYYTASLPEWPSSSVYRIPVLGGIPPRRIITNVVGAVSPSPDDSRLAFFRGFPDTGEEALFVVNADGTGEINLTKRDGKNLFYITRGAAPAWSPDGSVIACPSGSITDAMKLSILMVPLKDPRDVQFTEKYWSDMGRIVWYPDGSGLVFCAQSEGERSQISYMSYPGGDVSRITNDLLTYGPTSLSITRDGSAIVTVQGSSSSTIMLVPGGDGSRIQEITKGATRNDGNAGIAWMDDQRILFSSNRARTTDIWMSSSDGGDGKQMTFSTLGAYAPATSPARKEIFYLSNDEKISHIWRMKSDGSNATRVTDSEDYNPEVSRDGKWLLFDSWKSGARSIWMMGIDAKDTATLFCHGATIPRISPDGKLVVCRYYDGKEKRERMGLLSFPDGKLMTMFDLPLTANLAGFRWAPDGKSIHYIDARKGVSNIWAFDYSTNTTRQVSSFTSGRIFSFAWSPDGKNLAVARGQSTSDVVMLTMTR